MWRIHYYETEYANKLILRHCMTIQLRFSCLIAIRKIEKIDERYFFITDYRVSENITDVSNLIFSNCRNLLKNWH
jgi:hypothetical protein